MKYCGICNTPLPPDAEVCSHCGSAQGYSPAALAAEDRYIERVKASRCHTAEFSPDDISKNKPAAMLPHLLGIIGLIIAIIMNKNRESEYLDYQVRIAIKHTVVEALIIATALVLFWTAVAPVLGIICLAVAFILRIISFVNICRSEVKDPPIISSIKFLA